MIELNFVFLLANGIFTLFCAFSILYLIGEGRLSRHRFYVSWIIGFTLYGAQLIVRALFAEGTSVLQGILMIGAVSLFISSVWDMSIRRHLTYFLLLVIFLSVFPSS